MVKIDTIRRYLRPQRIMSRKSTFSNAFASALAPHDSYSLSAVAEAIRDLGQDPEKDLACVYCGSDAATWDHVFNRVIKGEFSGKGHHIRNLVPCCRNCNERKGPKHWRDWLAIRSPSDFEARSAKMEKFLAGADTPQSQEGAAAPSNEVIRYLEIRRTVFELLQEADDLAAVIRKQSYFTNIGAPR